MTQKTTLQDFCQFLENKLQISLSDEKWEVYYQAKEHAIVNEYNQLVDAYLAGTAQFDNAAAIVYPKAPMQYVIEKYGELPNQL